eukprot:12422614-Karenia_brevis.AAC.1
MDALQPAVALPPEHSQALIIAAHGKFWLLANARRDVCRTHVKSSFPLERFDEAGSTMIYA